MGFADDEGEMGLANSSQQCSRNTTAAGCNLLVESAAALFSVVNRLNGMGLSFRSDEFLEGLTEEMRIFENKISTRYNTNFLMMARSVLCAFIDEMVARSEWGVKNRWSPDTLSQVFITDDEAKTFFVILDQAIQDPVAHLDLLEFIYLCLHFGFEGRYKEEKKANFSCTDTINNLYHLLQKYRRQVSEDLLVSPVRDEIIKPPRLQPASNGRFWLGLVGGVVITLLTTGAIYLFLDAKLQSVVNVMYKNFARLL